MKSTQANSELSNYTEESGDDAVSTDDSMLFDDTWNVGYVYEILRDVFFYLNVDCRMKHPV